MLGKEKENETSLTRFLSGVKWELHLSLSFGLDEARVPGDWFGQLLFHGRVRGVTGSCSARDRREIPESLLSRAGQRDRGHPQHICR